MKRAADLVAIPDAACALASAGALRDMHPKGVREVNDHAIFATARADGLTYTKVVGVSPTRSAARLVVLRAAGR